MSEPLSVKVLAFAFVDTPGVVEVHSSPEASDADRDMIVAEVLARDPSKRIISHHAPPEDTQP